MKLRSSSREAVKEAVKAEPAKKDEKKMHVPKAPKEASVAKAKPAVRKRKTSESLEDENATKKRGKRAAGTSAPPASKGGHESPTVKINRAPVLTLWVAVVAERQGFSREEALTFGRYVSGLLAHSKGKSLGMYEDREKTEEEIEARRRRDRELGVEQVQVFGMKVPTVAAEEAGGGRRAVTGGKPIDPGSVDTYLKHAFGTEAMESTKAAMQALAGAIPGGLIGKVAYKLYERFRPAWSGWGQKGDLSLQGIHDLAGSWSSLG